MDYSIAGVLILPLIVGLVEFAKDYGIEGKWSRLFAVALGLLFGGLWYAINQGIIPEAAMPWIGIPVFGLAFGLGAAGLYDLGKRFAFGQ